VISIVRISAAREQHFVTDPIASSRARVAAAESRIVCPGSDGRLVYKAINERGDRIIDFSSVGYMGGGVRIPDVPVRLVLKPGGRGTDDGARIQAAIDSIASLPIDGSGFRGAIFLKRGRYVCSRVLTIAANGIVLRGEGDGPEGTCLVDGVREKNDFISITGSGSLEEIPGSRVNIVDDYVPVGSFVVHVSDGSGFSPGDKVCVDRPGTKEWLRVLGTDNLPKDFPDVKDWTPEQYHLRWERTIVSIRGTAITLDAPIVDALNKRLGQSSLYKYAYEGRVSQIGIENLRLESVFDDTVKRPVTLELIRDGLNGARSQDDLESVHADENHGWAAVRFEAAENCWVRNVTSKSFGYSCVMITASAKYVTVQDCTCLDPVSLVYGGRRYSFYVNGQLNLVQRCYSRQGRHDFVLAARTCGPNVFLDCVAEQSWSMNEPHHRWSQGGLWDNVVAVGPWACLQAVNRSSSGTGHGWAGVNMVFWNCDAKCIFIQEPPTGQNFSIGRIHTLPYVYRWSFEEDRDEMVAWIEFHAKKKFPYEKEATVIGDGYIEYPTSTVTPRSLYLQQLKDRLGMEAVRNVTTEEQRRKFFGD
jgi:hypothetical protein